MKVVRTLVTAALALAMILPRGAVAQQMSPSVHFGITGGLSVPLGDFSSGYQTGYLVTTLVEGTPSGSPVGLRAEFTYSGYSVKHYGFTTNILEFVGNGVINLDTPNSGLYLIGGGGIYHFTAAGGALSSNNLGLNGGVGYRWPLAGASTFVEGRYHWVSTSGSATTFIPIVFGVVF